MRTIHSRITTTTLASALALILTACGGGSGSRVDDIANPPGGGPGASSHKIGYGSGTSFVSGAIGVGIGADTLSAGGTTSLTVNVVNQDNALSTSSAEIRFNSRCIAANEAILSANPVTTTNGQASINYTANGCAGQDEITATTTLDNQILTARTTLSVEADIISSIQFVDATPQQISLKGTGGSETSSVRFLVKGSTGAPIKGACVEFTLNTQLGGLDLVNSKCDATDPDNSKRARTNEEGHAAIFVQAGTLATPVTVTAKHLDSGLSTQSRDLYVSTGIPDQKSMSLSASVKNPNAWNYDGEIVTFTVRLADAFNNPPADGTVVSFTTSGGSITPSCSTENGVCSVAWTSQNPRPQGVPRNGHVRVLAHTTGNESFIDQNGDGWYTPGVDTFASDNDACRWNVPPSSAEDGPVSCDDLGEAFRDHNHSGVYEHGKWFLDFNQNGIWDEPDGLYNGILCREQDASAGLCSRSGVTIRRDYLIIMSSNQPLLENGLLVGQPAVLDLNNTNSFVAALADIHGNPLPAGTKVELDASNAKNVNVSPAEITIPSTHEPQPFPAIVTPSGNEPPEGYLQIKITTPDGLITSTAPTFIKFDAE